jgi:hypothetical protein
LRARAPEIEKAILTRIRNLSGSLADDDPAYRAGLRGAVTEALSYSLANIEEGGISAPIPPETIAQARRAAREGVGLDTVLRRYAAGNKVLEEFLVAEADGIPSQLLCQILSEQGIHVDRLMESVSIAYGDEAALNRRSAAQERADRIAHLLHSDSLVAPADLDYDFDVWHLGMILIGPGGEKLARAVAETLRCRLLPARRDQELTWAWLGNSQPPVATDLEQCFAASAPAGVSMAIGEPRRGLDGWRQTHHEAQMAFRVMLHQPKPVTRSRDVILDSAVLKDRRLAMSLIETYLAPLDGRGNSGETLRKTLRAYFKADQNVVSAAQILGKARHTVERHLRKVEERLGQTLDTCNVQLQVALRAEELVLASELAQLPSHA